MTEQTNEERTPNNVLTSAQMFKLTREVEKRATSPETEPAETWKVAEEIFSALIGRPVTRPNILTALTALDDVTQSQVVKPRGASTGSNGDLDSKIESIDRRINQLVFDVGRLERFHAEQGDTSDDKLTGRLDAVDEVLAREAARIDTAESNREAVREMTARHEAEIGQLKLQNERLMDVVSQHSKRLSEIAATVEKPFALNSGGDFAEGLPPASGG